LERIYRQQGFGLKFVSEKERKVEVE